MKNRIENIFLNIILFLLSAVCDAGKRNLVFAACGSSQLLFVLDGGRTNVEIKLLNTADEYCFVPPNPSF